MPTTKSSLVERIGNIEHFLIETGVNSVSTGAREAEGKPATRLHERNSLWQCPGTWFSKILMRSGFHKTFSGYR